MGSTMRMFTVMSFDEGGTQSTERAIRLVCPTETREKVAIWGSVGNTRNIDKVLGASLPCEIECETKPPNEWARLEHGHDYGVPEDARLRVRPAGHLRQRMASTT